MFCDCFLGGGGRSPLLWLAAALASSPALGGEPVPHSAWQVAAQGAKASSDGLRDGVCTVKCEVGAKLVWQQSVCGVLDTDYVFVARDCASVLVLFSFPVKDTPLETSIVAQVIGAEGQRGVPLGEVAPGYKPQGTTRLRWLAGALDAAGEAPRLSPDGASVTFTTLDTQVRSLPFSTRVKVAAPSRRREGEDELYQWVDPDGTVHVVRGAAAVPPSKRRQATRIDAQLQRDPK